MIKTGSTCCAGRTPEIVRQCQQEAGERGFAGFTEKSGKRQVFDKNSKISAQSLR